jgi:hypothetical protein
MYALPPSLGRALLSHSWAAGHSVLIPLTIAAAASGILTGATVGLRALAAAKRSMRVRLITAAITIAASTVGAITAGATGAAAGLAFGLSVGALMWVVELNSATREAARALEAEPAAGAPT